MPQVRALCTNRGTLFSASLPIPPQRWLGAKYDECFTRSRCPFLPETTDVKTPLLRVFVRILIPPFVDITLSLPPNPGRQQLYRP